MTEMQASGFAGVGGTLLALVLGVLLYRRARRRGAAAAPALAGAAVYTSNLNMTISMGFHLLAVIGHALMGRGTVLEGGPHFQYTFRFYSLILFGASLAGLGVFCVSRARTIAEGTATGMPEAALNAWRSVVRAHVILLAILLPATPFQLASAGGLSLFILADLVFLWRAKRALAPMGSADAR